jgi:hypothetical protein
MNISYSKSSLKYLSKLEKKKRVNIVSAIDQLPIRFAWKGPDIRILFNFEAPSSHTSPGGDLIRICSAMIRRAEAAR